jgi:serine/threonine protein kinase
MHLDFKLANCMFFYDQNKLLDPQNFDVKLIDFGGARTTNSHKTVHGINAPVMNRYAVMTFQHCAPEQTNIKTSGNLIYVEVITE